MGDDDTRRATQIRLIAVALVVVILEGVSYLGLWLLPKVAGLRAPRTATIFRDQTRQIQEYFARQPPGRDQIDPDLGWHYRADYTKGGDRINAQQLRSLHEYAPEPGANVIRVAVFGDSFVYGSEVDTKDAWPSVIERLYSTVEVLNYGVGGYGDDQAYLRFAREGLAFKPSVVILGFTPDDLRRLTNVYRKFIDDREFAWTKPRFLLGPSGKLTLRPPPLRDSADYARLIADPRMALQFGEHDQWFERAVYRNPLYDYSATVRLITVLGVRVYNRAVDKNRLRVGSEFNAASEAFSLELAVAARFVTEARGAGKRPLIMLCPDEASIRQARDRKRVAYSSLVDSLHARGFDVIDPTGEFLGQGAGADIRTWFAPGGHYSPLGNQIVARVVGREILQRVRGSGT